MSFYHFFSSKPRAKYNIYLNNSITANMRDREGVKEALEKACGTTFGNVT
ncbi:MAG: NAD(P)H-dependent oxidoreductase subunit E, partial [Gammaproteobacteria bacterium]